MAQVLTLDFTERSVKRRTSKGTDKSMVDAEHEASKVPPGWGGDSVLMYKSIVRQGRRLGQRYFALEWPGGALNVYIERTDMGSKEGVDSA